MLWSCWMLSIWDRRADMTYTIFTGPRCGILMPHPLCVTDHQQLQFGKHNTKIEFSQGLGTAQQGSYISHMLHGAGIFANICPKNHPVMWLNIPAPWSIWVWSVRIWCCSCWVGGLDQHDHTQKTSEKLEKFWEKPANSWGFFMRFKQF